MAVAARRETRTRAAEYWDWTASRRNGERRELTDGAAVLVAPPTERNRAIVSDSIRRLDTIGATKGCRVLPNLGLLDDVADDCASIPDAVIHRGSIRTDRYARVRVLEADFDRTLPGLLLIADQDMRCMDVRCRTGVGRSKQTVRPAGTIVLADLDDMLDVAAPCSGIPFDPA